MRAFKHLPDILHRFKEGVYQEHANNYLTESGWIHLSTDDIVNSVHYLALALKDLGLKKGDRVGVFSKSSPFWSIADFSIALAGGVSVPFLTNLSSEHFLFEAKHSSPRFIFVGDKEDREFVEPHRKLFERMIGLEPSSCEPPIMDYRELLKTGKELYNKNPGMIEKMENEIRPEDLATIIYSSGSTGNPKGVELSHKNLVSIIHYDEFFLRSNDKYLSVLPLAHIFARQIHYIITAWGVPIYFLNDLTKMSEVSKEIPITRMITVPRILEKVYSKLCEKVKSAPPIKRVLASWAFDLAHREDSLYKKVMHPIADKLVYTKIREAFGKNFHSILSGGAALSPHLHRFYLSVGIPIVQGWGLTEGSCMAVNRLSQNKMGTVGPPVKGIHFKISEHGEVLAKGPTIMRGYHKNPEATKRAIDEGGWLHTGDSGYLDKDGHLVIRGRMNDSFKTSKGKFVNPVEIEQKLCESPLIDMAMVFGSDRPYPALFLFPDIAAVERLKKKKRMQSISTEDFLQSESMIRRTEKLLNQVNAGLDKWQRIHSFRYILTAPTITGGELTPTLKLRRHVILEKYKALVEEIYREGQTSSTQQENPES